MKNKKIVFLREWRVSQRSECFFLFIFVDEDEIFFPMSHDEKLAHLSACVYVFFSRRLAAVDVLN